MFCHLYCPNFLIQCERLFKPELHTKALLVISNGELIACSEQAQKRGFHTSLNKMKKLIVKILLSAIQIGSSTLTYRAACISRLTYLRQALKYSRTMKLYLISKTYQLNLVCKITLKMFKAKSNNGWAWRQWLVLVKREA